MNPINKKTKKKREKTMHYTVFQQRLEPDIQDWLKAENINYKSWNIFFREIKRRYNIKKE